MSNFRIPLPSSLFPRGQLRVQLPASCVQRTAFSIQHSAFSIQRSALSVELPASRSSLPASRFSLLASRFSLLASRSSLRASHLTWSGVQRPASRVQRNAARSRSPDFPLPTSNFSYAMSLPYTSSITTFTHLLLRMASHRPVVCASDKAHPLGPSG